MEGGAQKLIISSKEHCLPTCHFYRNPFMS